MLFISHSSQDKPFVQRLAVDLLNKDIDVWLDGWELELGDELTPRIRNAVEHGDCLLLVLSPAAVRSPWVGLEVKIALEREEMLGATLLIPVRIAACHGPEPVAD